MIDIDLRWGVTEQEALDGKALDICLDEIDSCRPFFLGLLGHRYGYTPPGALHSITAEEIYHGVLHGGVPRQIVDLPRIVEGKLENQVLSSEDKQCLAQSYFWDAAKRKYCLRQDLAAKDGESIRSIFNRFASYQRNRSFFYFRDLELSEELAGSNREDFFETNPLEIEKLESLKCDIKDAGLSVEHYSTIEEFGSRVLAAIWQKIELQDDQPPAASRDWLEAEKELHDLFMADRVKGFVGRHRIMAQLMEPFLKDPTSAPNLQIVTGEPGCGKSSLLARFAEEFARRNPEWRVLTHFVGASPQSTSARRMLRRFCSHLGRFQGSGEPAPEDFSELRKVFLERLQELTNDQKTLIVIDAVNQLERTDHAHSLDWLPRQIPANAFILISTLREDTYTALQLRSPKPKEYIVPGLASEEIVEVTESFLKEIRHRFPNAQLKNAFLKKVAAGNPLYILVALEELRLFGEFASLGQRIAALPDTIPKLFDQVVARIESDFAPGLVRECLCFIACGRNGMAADELQYLLARFAVGTDPTHDPSRYPEMSWLRLFRAFGTYLFERSGTVDFFHGQLKQAVEARYLNQSVTRKDFHGKIAGFFAARWRTSEPRALSELPFQLTKAEDQRSLVQLLTNLSFIEMKSAAGMVFDLVDDFDKCVTLLQSNKEKGQGQSGDEICRYYQNLLQQLRIHGAGRKGDQPTGECFPHQPLPVPPAALPLSQEQSANEIERIAARLNDLDRMADFQSFLVAHVDALTQYAAIPFLCLQLALNYADVGPVRQSALKLYEEMEKPFLILRQQHDLSPFQPFPQTIKTIQIPRDFPGQTGPDGYSWCVDHTEMDAHGRMVCSLSLDHIIRIWDLNKGLCVGLIDQFRDRFFDRADMILNQDGSSLLVYEESEDRVYLFATDGGQCYRAIDCFFKGSRHALQRFCGQLLITKSEADTFYFWDLEHASILHAYLHEITDLAAARLGQVGTQAVYMNREGMLSSWDILNGHKLHSTVLSLHSIPELQQFSEFSSKIVLNENTDLYFVDLLSGERNRVPNAHSGCIQATSMTLDGQMLASTGNDSAIFIWSTATGRLQKRLVGHHSLIRALQLSPEGRTLLSGSYDETIRLWDVEKGLPESKQNDRQQVYEFDPSSYCPPRISHVHISRDGRWAMSRDEEDRIKLWNTQASKEIESPVDTQYWMNVNTNKFDFFHDDKLILGYFPGNRLIRLWDRESAACLMEVALEDAGRERYFSPDQLDMVEFRAGGWITDFDSRSRWEGVTEYGDSVPKFIGFTPDGRTGIMQDRTDRLVAVDLKNKKVVREMPNVGGVFTGHTMTFFSCGSHFILATDFDLQIWDFIEWTCRAVLPVPERITAFDCTQRQLVVGDFAGHVHFFEMELPGHPLPVITAWFHKAVPRERSLDPTGKLTAICKWCGNLFSPDTTVSEKILKNMNDCRDSWEGLPFLRLPDEAWEHPALKALCPLCRQPLKFNPFYRIHWDAIFPDWREGKDQPQDHF